MNEYRTRLFQFTLLVRFRSYATPRWRVFPRRSGAYELKQWKSKSRGRICETGWKCLSSILFETVEIKLC